MIKEIVRRYPLISYATIAFTLSWGSVWFHAGGWSGFPAKHPEADLPIVVAATLLGPSIAGFIMTRLAGDCTLLQRFRKWNFSTRSYVITFLTAPLLVTALLLGLSVFSTEYVPAIVSENDKLSLVKTGIGYGLAAGFFEETGWSGFAVPQFLRYGYSDRNTGIMVGLWWGLWHFLVAFWGSGTADSGEFDWDLFTPWVPWNLLVLPAYRILMVMVYQETKQSLLAMAFMHGCLTASLPLILMPPCKGNALSAFYTLFGIALMILYRVVGPKSDMKPLKKHD